jgi:hypothetical protein
MDETQNVEIDDEEPHGNQEHQEKPVTQDAPGKTGGNPVFEGRKIIFVYPPAWIKEELISELILNGYEGYTLPDHRNLSKVIALYPGAILFLNLDKGLSQREWIRILSGLRDKIISGSIRIAILSEDSSRESVAAYLRDIPEVCGYISSRNRHKDISRSVVQIAAREDSRGRRRYIRASCVGLGNATVNLKKANDFHHGDILDISYVGMACRIPSLDGSLAVRDILSDMQLRLNTRLCTVSGKVAGVRQGSVRVYVVMFELSRAASVDEKIYAYIQETIQKNFEKRMGT